MFGVVEVVLRGRRGGLLLMLLCLPRRGCVRGDVRIWMGEGNKGDVHEYSDYCYVEWVY